VKTRIVQLGRGARGQIREPPGSDLIIRYSTIILDLRPALWPRELQRQHRAWTPEPRGRGARRLGRSPGRSASAAPHGRHDSGRSRVSQARPGGLSGSGRDGARPSGRTTKTTCWPRKNAQSAKNSSDPLCSLRSLAANQETCGRCCGGVGPEHDSGSSRTRRRTFLPHSRPFALFAANSGAVGRLSCVSCVSWFHPNPSGLGRYDRDPSTLSAVEGLRVTASGNR